MEQNWILVGHGVEEQAGLSQQFAVVERELNLFEMAAVKEMRDTASLVMQGVAALGVVA